MLIVAFVYTAHYTLYKHTNTWAYQHAHIGVCQMCQIVWHFMCTKHKLNTPTPPRSLLRRFCTRLNVLICHLTWPLSKLSSNIIATTSILSFNSHSISLFLWKPKQSVCFSFLFLFFKTKIWLMQAHGKHWVAFHCCKQKLVHAIRNCGCSDSKRNIKRWSKWVWQTNNQLNEHRTCDWCSVFFLSQYVQNNKDSGTDWFRLESNKEGTKWFGTCWCMHNLLKYEFKVEFDVSTQFSLVKIRYDLVVLNQFLLGSINCF